MRLRTLAPAKVNLFLHVGALQADGMHPLAGLSAFADVGDVVTLDTEGPGGLTVEGPMSSGVPAGAGNLMLRALEAFARRTGIDASGLSLTLDKRLPPASGLGGGSSDAGAVLRLARAAVAPDLPDADLLRIAGELGADGPMCVFPRVAWTEGRGEVLTPEPRLPPLHAVLVNPGVPSPTGVVFQAYDRGPARAADRPAAPRNWSLEAVIHWLSHQRNDLETAADGLAPAIGAARSALEAAPGVGLVRMSGSGATVFGLFASEAAAAHAATAIARRRLDWWTVATRLQTQVAAVSRPGPSPLG